MEHSLHDDSPLLKSLTDTEVVIMLKNGFLVDNVIVEELGITLLHFSVVTKNTKNVKILLEHKANVNIKTKQGIVPLQLAIEKNYLDLVKLLIKYGANVNDESLSTSPLINAIEFGYLEVVKLLINAGSNVHQATYNNMHVTPLHIAVNLCLPKIVKLLLENGAKVNCICSYSGNTPLLDAANNHIMLPEEKEKGKKVKQIVEMLLQYGAKVNVIGIIGMNPLDVALMVDNYDIVELLLQAGCKSSHLKTILFPAVKGGDAKAIRVCLEFGEDYNFTDMGSKTPYHHALGRQNTTALSTFWRFGCPFDQTIKCFPKGIFDIFTMVKITAKNKQHLKNQQSFIEGILQNRDGNVLDALNKGAEARGCSEALLSPIHLVTRRGNVQLSMILLERGVPANTLVKGETPIHNAAEEGHDQVCKLLLAFGACYNYKCKRGNPLHLSKDPKTKKLFVTVGRAFKAVKNGDEWVLKKLHYCVQKDIELFWALMNSVNHYGVTLMVTALKRNHIKIAEGIMKFRINAELDSNIS